MDKQYLNIYIIPQITKSEMSNIYDGLFDKVLFEDKDCYLSSTTITIDFTIFDKSNVCDGLFPDLLRCLEIIGKNTNRLFHVNSEKVMFTRENFCQIVDTKIVSLINES